jgi:hypothetical protein
MLREIFVNFAQVISSLDTFHYTNKFLYIFFDVSVLDRMVDPLVNM